MARVARAWAELMARLGYERYGAHGNDSGSMISPEIGRHDPERVAGVHVTQLFSFPSGDPAEFADLSEEDAGGDAVPRGVHRPRRAGLQRLPVRAAADARLRAAGLARRLAGVGHAALPARGRPRLHPHLRVDVLADRDGRLARSATTTPRRARSKPTAPTTAPTGVAIFAEDFQSIRRFADRDHANIVHWRHYDRGSHFSPHDAPDELVGDIREFFRSLR